ncbi:MAG TPA: hypothetical protein VEX68_31145 [Bryobacteraceae bacterium]|nr:hypothetical protein [Bryobacteraceae bacterium]
MPPRTATKKTAAKKVATKNPSPPPTARLIPPKDGATVRMYRTGHGDCFLLAFRGKKVSTPVYVLIDCGYKPGSPDFINTKIKEITANIRAATGGHIDIAVITHEHQDHVNGITEANYTGITIGKTWLAWTEDPSDDLANDLRKKFKDKLLGLLAARNRLAAAGDDKAVEKIDSFLAFELGGDDTVSFNAATAEGLLKAAGESMNKKSMKVFKDLSKDVKYLRPHEKILTVPGTKDVRVFALGPPRDPELIADLNPTEDEGFHPLTLGAASAGNYFAVAAAGEGVQPPFAKRFCITQPEAMTDSMYGGYFTQVYGDDTTPPSIALGIPQPGPNEVEGNAVWRRIDKDWLHSADQLALAMNSQTNNASLVLAFELGKRGKVLLFAADAQRGNWVSWSKKDWTDGNKKVTAKDLLSRTVLYKVGHHGSHNATLNGKAQDAHANLSWMAEGDYAGEFTAMITAVRAWAETQNGWDHPLKAIKDALLKKACGRVFQTDTSLTDMEKFKNSPAADWTAFKSRAREDRIYFDYDITE